MFRRKNLSNSFIKNLIDLSAGRISPKVLDEYLALLETEIKRNYFTETSETNLLRIIRSQYDISLFINESIKYPHHIEILTTIVSNSNYLSDIIVINPEYFSWIINPSTIKQKLETGKFIDELQLQLQHHRSFDAKVHTLKSIKRKEILRIGLKDIFLKEDLKQTTEELSILANALTSELFVVCYEEVLKKYSIKKINREYCLVALGKLGGLELNYSSDIDLLLFYDENQKLKSGKYFSELLIEAAHLFIQSSTEIKGGFLYRIDFRLRPDGKFSQLCRSLNEYLNYYEGRGEDWERQMLIKSGFVGGSLELYKKFIDYLSAFVYPSSFSVSPHKQILRMKESIERRLKDETNIKLSFGGIRDIEFSVQALQLINGGNNKSIRTGDTLKAIEELENANLLTSSEAEIFSSSYKFFRRIEHYLQLMNDRQTHEIPDEGEILEKLSSYFGFKNSKEFKNAVTKTRSEVRKIYDTILASDENQQVTSFEFSKIEFEDSNKAISDLLYLREGRGIIGTRTFDTKSIQSFLNIEDKLYKHLQKTIFPDRLLANIVRLIRQANFPSIWYQELLDEKFFEHFMRVFELSQYSVDLLAEDKELREFFLSRKVFLNIPIKELNEYNLKHILFYLSVQVITGLRKPLDVSLLLGSLLKSIIKNFVDDFAANAEWKNDYFFAVLGSLGSSAITFYSDLDILFIVKGLTKYPAIEKEVQDILTDLRELLKPFTIDCRLRPEGKSSQLVWDIEDSGLYFQKRARVWEFQTMTKISFVTGNKRLFNRFTKKTAKSLSKFKPKEIKDEMIEMHKRLTAQKLTSSADTIDVKKGSGGITDIEFIVQHLLLSNSELYGKSFDKGFSEHIQTLINVSSKKRDMKSLNESFELYKSIELINQLIFTSTSSRIRFDEKKLRAFNAIMNYSDSAKLREELESKILSVKEIFKKVFN